jgi:hypothetical protein
MKKLDSLQAFDPIWSPYAFDRVTISKRALIPATAPHGSPISTGPTVIVASLLGRCYSGYRGGPSLFLLADAAGELFGPGFYGLESCRALPL